MNRNKNVQYAFKLIGGLEIGGNYFEKYTNVRSLRILDKQI